MCAILQLVLAPLNRRPIADHFRSCQTLVLLLVSLLLLVDSVTLFILSYKLQSKQRAQGLL